MLVLSGYETTLENTPCLQNLACWCGINCTIQLHPTRMGYGSCLLSLPLSLPRPCPHPAFFRKTMRSPAAKVQNLPDTTSTLRQPLIS